MKAKKLAADDAACPMNYPAFVFRELRKRGYEADALLRGTTLTEERFQDPNALIEFAMLRRFILNAIELTGDPHLGPRLALHFEASYIGAPAYAALNAPRLLDGLEVFGRFVHLTFPAVEFTPPERDDNPGRLEAAVRLRPAFPLEDLEGLEDVAYFVTSSALLVVNALLRDMLRMPLVASRCECVNSEPVGWAEIAPEITRIPVRFGASEHRILFPIELLEQPLPGADPINHERFVRLCEQFSAETAFVSSPVSQVVSFLESADNPSSSLSDTAAALGYSERSLRRHLERSGVSYRKLVEQLQEKRARDMLANTSQPIHIIAHTLGYETPSNFARSFKRWTGETPKAFRKRHGVAANNGPE